MLKKQTISSPDLPASEKPKDEKKTKHKISFIDKIEKKELTRTHYVLSYKKYNSMNTFDMDL